MYDFFPEGDVARGAQEMDVANESTDTVREAGVVYVGGVGPEAVTEFRVGVRGG